MQAVLAAKNSGAHWEMQSGVTKSPSTSPRPHTACSVCLGWEAQHGESQGSAHRLQCSLQRVAGKGLQGWGPSRFHLPLSSTLQHMARSNLPQQVDARRRCKAGSSCTS